MIFDLHIFRTPLDGDFGQPLPVSSRCIDAANDFDALRATIRVVDATIRAGTPVAAFILKRHKGRNQPQARVVAAVNLR